MLSGQSNRTLELLERLGHVFIVGFAYLRPSVACSRLVISSWTVSAIPTRLAICLTNVATHGQHLVMLATVFVAFERIWTAAVVGGVGVWLLARCI